MKTTHTFRIVEEDDTLRGECIYPQTDMSIHSEAGLEDMLYAFERFLEASGYILPSNSVLDFVIEDQLNCKEGGNFGNV